MAKQLTEEQIQEQKQYIQGLVERARTAMCVIRDYDQTQVDRLCQAIGWALANEKTFTRLADMSIDESGLGDRVTRYGKRFKIYGILRDVLRQKSMGIIEEIPEKGLVKYAKPVGVIASLVPVTNAALTEVGTGIFAIKAKNATIFAPHPAAKNTTIDWEFGEGLSAADLNGDDNADAVVSGSFRYPNGIAVCLSNGDGTFQSPVFYPAGSDEGVGNPVIGDFNGDGILDVMLGGASGIWFFQGKGGGMFDAGVLAVSLHGVTGGRKILPGEKHRHLEISGGH